MPPYGVALTDGGTSVRAVGDGVLDVPFVGSGRGAAGDS